MKNLKNATYMQKRNVKNVGVVSIAAAAVRQMVTTSAEISGGIIRSDANSRGSVWSALS